MCSSTFSRSLFSSPAFKDIHKSPISPLFHGSEPLAIFSKRCMSPPARKVATSPRSPGGNPRTAVVSECILFHPCIVPLEGFCPDLAAQMDWKLQRTMPSPSPQGPRQAEVSHHGTICNLVRASLHRSKGWASGQEMHRSSSLMSLWPIEMSLSRPRLPTQQVHLEPWEVTLSAKIVPA